LPWLFSELALCIGRSPTTSIVDNGLFFLGGRGTS
jgi:hypothetical protein